MAPLTGSPSPVVPAAVPQPSPPPNAPSQPRSSAVPSASTSPATDVDMPAADSVPSKRAANAAEKPPLQKRPRRLTWYDSVRDAWKILVSRFPQRQQFKLSEIVETVNSQWVSLRGKEKKSSRWRKEIAVCIRSDTILTRSADTSDEYFVLRDLHYVPKPNAKKSQPAKKKEFSDDDAKLPDEQLSRATVPYEWTAEAFKPVRISTFDKSPAIQFIGDPSENTLKGYKGFRMARSTSGVCEGDWFFEAKVLPYEGDGAVRVGWSQRRSDPETPVGFDMYGYGYRDRTGGFVHAARVRPYAEKFGISDVIGCRIQLPSLSDEQKQRIRDSDAKWLHHRFINLLQGQPPQDCDIDIHGQAYVQFYKNGREMGIPAFFTEKEPADSRSSRKTGAEKRPNEHLSKKSSAGTKRRLCAGYFYPSVSLYGNAIVQANFGPSFTFSLPEGSRPMSEAARDAPPHEAPKNSVDPAQGRGKDAVADDGNRQGANRKKSEDAGNANADSVESSAPAAAKHAQEDHGQRSNGEEQNGAEDVNNHTGQSNQQNDNGSRSERGHAKTHNAHGVAVGEHTEKRIEAIGNKSQDPISATGKDDGTGTTAGQAERERTFSSDAVEDAPSEGNAKDGVCAEKTQVGSSTKATIGHIVNP